MSIPLPRLSSNRKRGKILSLIVVLAGILVMAGWIADIPFLKSIIPGWASMKFNTAVCFVLSGILLYSIIRMIEGHRDWAQVVISITSLIILLIMGTMFFSYLLGVHVGAEEMFIKDSDISSGDGRPGQPAFLTIISFLLIALSGVFALLGFSPSSLQYKIIGFSVIVIGALALIAGIIRMPFIYAYSGDVKAGMAIPAGALFLVLGMGYLCLSD